MLRILVVGAGAVGAVFAAALARGGAEVSALVRPRHAARLRRGIDLVELSGVRAFPAEARARFRPAHVFEAAADVPPDGFDQAWLCLPTPALDDPAIRALAARDVARAYVTIAPSLSSETSAATLAPHRVVQAIVGFLSFTRVDDRGREEIAFFQPPFSPSRFGGEPSRAAAAVEALRRGHLGAAQVEDAHTTLAYSSATLMPVIAGIEASDWSFAAFGRGAIAGTASRAIREACAVTEATLGKPAPLLPRLAFGAGLRVGLAVAPAMVPFDVEAFVRRHFVKVRAQTHGMFDEWLRAAETHGIETPNLAEIALAIGARSVGAAA